MGGRLIRLIVFKEVLVYPYAKGYPKDAATAGSQKYRDVKNASEACFTGT